jgi:hypothetical protein
MSARRSAGQFVRTTMLRQDEERPRVHAEILRTGSAAVSAYMQIAFGIAVRQLPNNPRSGHRAPAPPLP